MDINPYAQDTEINGVVLLMPSLMGTLLCLGIKFLLSVSLHDTVKKNLFCPRQLLNACEGLPEDGKSDILLDISYKCLSH